ncbi:hypothetical protein ACFX2J_031033 [Malus domestica]
MSPKSKSGELTDLKLESRTSCSRSSCSSTVSSSTPPTFWFDKLPSSNIAKSKVIENFKVLGVNFVLGDLYDHESSVNVIKQVDVVISTVKHGQLADQGNIITYAGSSFLKSMRSRCLLDMEIGYPMSSKQKLKAGDHESSRRKRDVLRSLLLSTPSKFRRLLLVPLCPTRVPSVSPDTTMCTLVSADSNGKAAAKW